MEAPLTTPRTIFIGDVHGMLDELDALTAKLDLQQGDRVVFVGDLIDKGPDPVGVVRRVGELSERYGVETILLRGNHEDKHLRYRRNLTERLSVANRQAKDAPVLAQFHAEASDADWAVLETTRPFVRFPELGILALHGGIPGNFETFPETEEEMLASKGKERDRLDKIWRTRFIDQDTGYFLGLGKARDGDPFWAEVYDGRFGHVVFGHQPFMKGPGIYPHATGIDTGAVHGGALTAMIVTPDGARDFISVPGRPFRVHLMED